MSSPEHLICLMAVVFSAVFFVNHATSFYANLDFASGDLGDSILTDFFVFYSTAHFLWDGGAAWDLYDSAVLKTFQLSLGAGKEGLHPFNYPPTYLFLIWPLGGLSYGVGLIVWQLLTTVAFAGGLHVAGLRRVEIFAAIIAPVTILNFSGGQNGCLTSALLIAGLALLNRRQVVAGSLFGLLTVKPHLGLLVPVVFLAGRRWQAVVAAGAVATALIVATVVVFGAQSWWAYFDFLDRFQAEVVAQTSGNFVSYSATVLMAAQIMNAPTILAYVIQLVISVGVCVAVYRAYRQSVDETLKLVLLLVGVSLVTPFGFVYDLPFMAVAVILLIRVGLRTGFLPYEVLCLVGVWHLPFLSSQTVGWGIPLAPWIHLVFFFFVLARLRQADRQPSC